MQETGTNNVDTLMDYIKKVNPKRAKELEWVAKEENQPKPDEWVSTMHYLARIYSNDTAAAMFLLDPKTTYEAMQETGSQDPEVLRDYLYKSNRQWLFFDARACTEGGVHDRIEREVGPSIAEKDYKIMLQEAEQAYKLKKSREQPIHSSILEEDAAKLMRGR
jgi:hypothetical protein